MLLSKEYVSYLARELTKKLLAGEFIETKDLPGVTVVAFRTEVKYKLKVRLANDTYLTEYIPDIQPDGPIPSEWKNDKPVEARIADHVLFIKLSYGPEIETHIVKRLKS